MRTAVRSGSGVRGRHQPVVLAGFRPTWAQAFAGALPAAALGGLLLALVGFVVFLVPQMFGATGGPLRWDPWWRPAVTVPELFRYAVPTGLPSLLLAAAVVRRWTGVRLDETGVRGGSLGLTGFVPWRLVTEIRAERRRGRTAVVLYLTGGRCVRLPAPYHGIGCAADSRFERKLFLIYHVWATYRDPDRRTGAAPVGDIWSRHG
jgi:hypothetical protein